MNRMITGHYWQAKILPVSGSSAFNTLGWSAMSRSRVCIGTVN